MDSQFEPKQFYLVRNIVDKITPPKSIQGFTEFDLATLISDSLIASGQKLETPLWRRENTFFIYHRMKPLPISKDNLKTVLKWVARKVGMAEKDIFTPSFQEILFNTAWKKLSDDAVGSTTF